MKPTSAKLSSERIIRWTGLIAMAGGILFPMAAVIHPNGEDLASAQMSHWPTAHLIGWVSVTLLCLGLVGLYARQIEQAGWLGLVAFVLAFLGSLFAITIQYMQSTVIPLIAHEAPALFIRATTPPPFAPPLFVLGFVGGFILFGVATIRARVLPRWSGVLVIIGMTLFLFGELSFLGQRLGATQFQAVYDLIRRLRPVVVFGDALFGLGIAWMGYSVWSKDLSNRRVHGRSGMSAEGSAQQQLQVDQR